MTSRLLISTSLAALLLASTAVQAEGGFKYRKLKPADPPCLFLLDENTGQPTGDPVNTPCVLGSQNVSPGDHVSAADRARHGQAAPRDAASGLPTGKRQHKPVSVTKPVDKASPKVADGNDLTMRKRPGRDRPVPPEPVRKPGPEEPAKPPGQD